jgi:hypothetical protein
MEKESRDRQLLAEKARKKVEKKQEFAQEVEVVQRLQNEMAHERMLMQEKRTQEREYLRKMLLENEANKAKAEKMANNEKANDIQALMEYGRMLDRQDQDRQREFEQRERRAQEFMNSLASNVIKNQHAKKSAEDEALARFEHDREMRMRMEDEKRRQRDAEEKAHMRELLARQM